MHPNKHVKNPHAPLPRPAMLPCTTSVLRGLPLRPRASWPPSCLSRSARRVLPAQAGAASGGARGLALRTPPPLRVGGAEEGSQRRMAAGGGGPGARSQRAAQITAQPAGRSGSRLCSRQSYSATGSRGAAPGSPSLPPPHCQAPSFAVSSSLPAELRPRGGRPVISERHAKTRGAGGGRRDAAAGSRRLWAPRLDAGLILEPRLPPPLAGLEERTKVRCRGSSQESSLPLSERARTHCIQSAWRCIPLPRVH